MTNPKTPLVLLLLILLSGCRSAELTRPPATGQPWDTTYLIDLDPGAVTADQLETSVRSASDAVHDRCQVLGVFWPLTRRDALSEPDLFHKGADSALFTGFALASFCYQWKVTGDEQAKTRAERFLRGVWYLTHVAGRGVIARCAFPLARSAEFDYPGAGFWVRRIEEGFMGETGTISAPWGEIEPSAFYTRATNDQLTGLLLGLASAWRFLEDQRPLVAEIVQDLHDRLVHDDWTILDARGTNDTNAKNVDGNLRLQFAALYGLTSTLSAPDRVADAEADYVDRLHGDVGDCFNGFNNLNQYFAHSLRAARILTVWLLARNDDERSWAADYYESSTWSHVAEHENGFFAAIRFLLAKDAEARTQADRALAALSLKPTRGWGSPYAGQDHEPGWLEWLFGLTAKWVLPAHLRKTTTYWTWQKEPWGVGAADHEGSTEGPWLDLAMPYWLSRIEDR